MPFQLSAMGVVVACMTITIGGLAVKTDSVTVFATVPGLSGFTTAKDGTIYALSSSENKIVRFNTDGRVIESIGPRLESGYFLQISPLFHPIHIDASGHIYVPSEGYLYILDASGHLINLDSKGRLPKGFEVGVPKWIGTNKRGDIYVYPAIDDEDSLVSVIASNGTRLASFGHTVFPQGSVPNTLFRVAMAEDDTLYAVFSNFPAILKYRSDQSFESLLAVRPGKGLESLIRSQDVSLDDALKAVSMNEPIRENHLIFTDAKFVDENTLVCVSSAQILWYDKSGRLLREFDQVHFMASAHSHNIVSSVTIGCGGNCLLGRVQRDDRIYRIAF
jgi:outer membrane protein assembly factor BamB